MLRMTTHGLRAACWLCCWLLTTVALAEPVKSNRPEELRVCFRPQPPFWQEADGGWTGLEYEILAEFATAQGLELNFSDPGTMLDVFNAVIAERCDLAAATITLTEERRQRMDFAPWFFPVRVVVVEKKESLTTRPEMLRGKTAATIPGSTYIPLIDGIGEVEKLWVEDGRDMFTALSEGRADFLASDSTIVLDRLMEFPDLRVTIPLSERQQLAFALPKGSPWTEPLRRFVETYRDDGRLKRLLSKYFDAEGVEMILSQ